MRRFLAPVALLLVIAACGDGATSSTLATLDSVSSETLASPAAPADTADLPESDYPDVVVADLSGGELHLRELALEEQPILLWFWAPH